MGNLVLAGFAFLAGYIGAQSGRCFSQLLEVTFPGVSWRIASLLLPVVLIGWFGVEAAIFGNLIGQIFELGEIARRVVMSVATVMFATTCYLGFRAIRAVSVILVPLIVVLGCAALVLRFINSLTFSSCTNRQKMAPYPYTTRTGSVSDAASEPLSNCAVGDRETDVDRSGGEIHAPVFRGAPRQDDSAGGRGLVQ